MRRLQSGGAKSPRGGRRKQYQITDTGKKVLDAEFERLEEMVENGEKYILR